MTEIDPDFIEAIVSLRLSLSKKRWCVNVGRVANQIEVRVTVPEAASRVPLEWRGWPVRTVTVGRVVAGPSKSPEWVRMYAPSGKTAHLVLRGGEPPNRTVASACGRYPGQGAGFYLDPDQGWLGTGSQAEYEKAARLPLCKTCERRA